MDNVKASIPQDEFSEILQARLHLNPRIIQWIIKELAKNIEDAKKWGKTFEEYCPVYNIHGNFIYATGERPDPEFVYIFSNQSFVVSLYTNNHDYMAINFNENLNVPTEQDIKKLKKEIFEIIESGKVFLLWDIKQENTKFKIIGC
ncbi:MAG: hypothetical protein ACN6NU_04845 [Acinetobacter sp.]|jgi:hypothetical protein